MTCNNTCIHYPVCEQKNWDFANIDECLYYCAKPERLQGKWIRYRDNPHQPEHIKCSNCGQYWSIADHDKIFDICFKCGADMRKGNINE